MAGALEFRKADDVMILLDHGQLRNLARILRLREAPLLSNLGSEVERIKYLDHVNDAHDKLVDLVTASEQHTQRYEQQNNQLKAEIAKAIEEYVVLGANWAMQCIRNVCMRLTCVEKLRDQFDGLVVELEKLDQNNQIDVEDLVEKLNKLKYYMWEYANTTRSEQARRRSREFSESLMMQGITVSYLLSRKASQLGFKPEFEDLEDQQTLQVYMAIINESRRAELPDLYNSDARKLGIFKKIDIAMLVVSSAVLVCDLFRAGEMPDGMEIAFNLSNGRMLED